MLHGFTRVAATTLCQVAHVTILFTTRFFSGEGILGSICNGFPLVLSHGREDAYGDGIGIRHISAYKLYSAFLDLKLSSHFVTAYPTLQLPA